MRGGTKKGVYRLFMADGTTSVAYVWNGDEDDLDGDRLRFYRLATYLSLVAGPLLLLDGDFPHRAGMRHIAEANIGRALAELS